MCAKKTGYTKPKKPYNSMKKKTMVGAKMKKRKAAMGKKPKTKPKKKKTKKEPMPESTETKPASSSRDFTVSQEVKRDYTLPDPKAHKRPESVRHSNYSSARPAYEQAYGNSSSKEVRSIYPPVMTAFDLSKIK